MELGGT